MDFSTIRTGITPVDFKFVDVCPRCGQMKELKEAEKDG
jgi:ATP sulfurylase